MKALSVKQPFANWLVEGIKGSEHRTYNTKFRGEVMIHSSKKADKEFIEKYGLNDWKFITGHIIGIVEIYDCKDLGNGVYAWKVRNAKKFKKQIEARGALSFWNVDNEILKILSEGK